MDKDTYKAFLKNSLREIKKAHNNNYLSIFAGAGVSRDSGMPSWDGLVEEIKKMFGNTTDKDDHLVVAEKFYIQFGESVYYEKLREFIPDDKKPNVIHNEMINLNVKNIITTNWDNLFERAVEDNGKFFNVIKKMMT